MNDEFRKRAEREAKRIVAEIAAKFPGSKVDGLVITLAEGAMEQERAGHSSAAQGLADAGVKPV